MTLRDENIWCTASYVSSLGQRSSISLSAKANAATSRSFGQPQPAAPDVFSEAALGYAQDDKFPNSGSRSASVRSARTCGKSWGARLVRARAPERRLTGARTRRFPNLRGTRHQRLVPPASKVYACHKICMSESSLWSYPEQFVETLAVGHFAVMFCRVAN